MTQPASPYEHETEPPPPCPATDPMLPEDEPDDSGDCAACLGTGVVTLTPWSWYAPAETRPCTCGAAS